MMTIDILKILFTRDLNKLKEEISLYKNESAIWKIENNILNSAGNLCLHLVGNLNTYIGAVFAQTGYVRDRPLEFSLKDISRQELLEKINETINVVELGLSRVPIEKMQEDFPIVIWNEAKSIEYTLMHLSTHLAYHLGQVNYHRRIIDL